MRAHLAMTCMGEIIIERCRLVSDLRFDTLTSSEQVMRQRYIYRLEEYVRVGTPECRECELNCHALQKCNVTNLREGESASFTTRAHFSYESKI